MIGNGKLSQHGLICTLSFIPAQHTCAVRITDYVKTENIHPYSIVVSTVYPWDKLVRFRSTQFVPDFCTRRAADNDSSIYIYIRFSNLYPSNIFVRLVATALISNFHRGRSGFGRCVLLRAMVATKTPRITTVAAELNEPSQALYTYIYIYR